MIEEIFVIKWLFSIEKSLSKGIKSLVRQNIDFYSHAYRNTPADWIDSYCSSSQRKLKLICNNCFSISICLKYSIVVIIEPCDSILGVENLVRCNELVLSLIDSSLSWNSDNLLWSKEAHLKPLVAIINTSNPCIGESTKCLRQVQISKHSKIVDIVCSWRVNWKSCCNSCDVCDWSLLQMPNADLFFRFFHLQFIYDLSLLKNQFF